jgi:hypothetical protein
MDLLLTHIAMPRRDRIQIAWGALGWGLLSRNPLYTQQVRDGYGPAPVHRQGRRFPNKPIQPEAFSRKIAGMIDAKALKSNPRTQGDYCAIWQQAGSRERGVMV